MLVVLVVPCRCFLFHSRRLDWPAIDYWPWPPCPPICDSRPRFSVMPGLACPGVTCCDDDVSLNVAWKLCCHKLEGFPDQSGWPKMPPCVCPLG